MLKDNLWLGGALTLFGGILGVVAIRTYDRRHPIQSDHVVVPVGLGEWIEGYRNLDGARMFEALSPAAQQTLVAYTGSREAYVANIDQYAKEVTVDDVVFAGGHDYIDGTGLWLIVLLATKANTPIEVSYLVATDTEGLIGRITVLQ